MVNLRRYSLIGRTSRAPVHRQYFYNALAVAKSCKPHLYCTLRTQPEFCFCTKFYSHHRTNATLEENRIEIINDSISYGILMTTVSVVQFLTGIVCIDLFNYTALKQVTRIRTKFFASLLRQEVGWYDVTSGTNFAVRITELVCNRNFYFDDFRLISYYGISDIEKIRDGIAEKVSHFMCLMVGFIICVVMSFYYGWKLTLVVIGYVPICLITNTIVSRVRFGDQIHD